MKPEERKYYESRDVRFNERLVYGDKYGKDSIKDWPKDTEAINKEKWFLEFEPENETGNENPCETTSNERVDYKMDIRVKRKRGRPPKSQNKVCSISCSSNDQNELKQVQTHLTIFPEINEPHEIYNEKDKTYHSLLAQINNDPTTFKEAINSNEKDFWLKAIKDELNSLKQNKVWNIVKRPLKIQNRKKPNIIDSKWVFKRKYDQYGGIKYKARLVIRGFKDRNVYDLLETYAPVSRLTLVRCLLSVINKYKLFARQLDVKTAFLNGELEDEIYMEIPEGCDNYDLKKEYVCELKRALYGLRVSSKRWYIRLTTVLTNMGMKVVENEPCLFYMIQDGIIVILSFYVDDILMASNNEEKINEMIKTLQNEFEINDLGEPSEFLGIRIRRNESKTILKLDQSTYIEKILKRFDFNESYPQRTPMITRQVANRQRRGRETETDPTILDETLTRDNWPYREAVGSLLYLANATRPDISYAVNVLSRHQIQPTNEDWKMVERVFRYLKGTKDLTLTYTSKTDDLQAYSDASFADCKGSLTTCGYIIKLFGDAVAWRTHKQSYVALSTCQAEYVAMSETCQEIIALDKSLSKVLETSFHPIVLWCDNKAAEASTKTDGGTKLRHMTEVREDYVKECVRRGFIKIKWIASKNQIADIFTKPLSFDTHKRLANEIMNTH